MHHGNTRSRWTAFGAPLEAGARIGAYRIVRPIASGGMGAVYEAVQDQPRRSVALKVLPTRILSPSSLRRFQYESELLGRLSHPNIAHVFEAGTYADGDVHFLPPISGGSAGLAPGYEAPLRAEDAVALLARHLLARQVVHDVVLSDVRSHAAHLRARAVEREQGQHGLTDLGSVEEAAAGEDDTDSYHDKTSLSAVVSGPP